MWQWLRLSHYFHQSAKRCNFSSVLISFCIRYSWYLSWQSVYSLPASYYTIFQLELVFAYCYQIMTLLRCIINILLFQGPSLIIRVICSVFALLEHSFRSVLMTIIWKVQNVISYALQGPSNHLVEWEKRQSVPRMSGSSIYE